MQRVNGPHKRIASALVLIIVVGATAATAFGRTGRAQPAAAQPPPSLTGSAKFPCTAQTCAVNPATDRSRVNVVPVIAPAGTTPTFYAGSTPTTGMIHRNSEQANLNCNGYPHPIDPDSVQFWIGGTFRGSVTYRVTDVVSNASPGGLQFCLGATFSFTTLSGQPATATTLPNGLSGFVGLVPSCGAVDPSTNPCLFSKTRPPGSKDAMLRVLVPAVGGEDPWGRA